MQKPPMAILMLFSGVEILSGPLNRWSFALGRTFLRRRPSMSHPNEPREPPNLLICAEPIAKGALGVEGPARVLKRYQKGR